MCTPGVHFSVLAQTDEHRFLVDYGLSFAFFVFLLGFHHEKKKAFLTCLLLISTIVRSSLYDRSPKRR